MALIGVEALISRSHVLMVLITSVCIYWAYGTNNMENFQINITEQQKGDAQIDILNKWLTLCAS
jgi:hypothetical protein